MATLETWQNRLSSHVGSPQPDSTHVSTQTVPDETERQGLRQRFLRLRTSTPTTSLITTESNDALQINSGRSQPSGGSHCVPVTLLPPSLEEDPAGQDIPGVKLKCFDKVVPEDLNNRFFDIKVLYTQPLIEAISHRNRNPGDISMKLKYLGLTARTAQFHIVIQCEKKVAKRVRKFFAQKHVEEELVPDFCILVLDKAPLRLATGDIIEVLPGKAPIETWCGTPIMMTRGTASATATLGGIIMIETSQKHLYGMTAAHPLKGLQESHTESLATRRNSESGSNYDPEDSESELDSVSDSERPESPLDRADDSLNAKRYESGYHEVLGTIFCDTFNTRVEKNYDWAVIDLSPERVLPNKVINTWQREVSGTGENAEAEVFLDESSSQSDALTKRVIVIKEGGPQPGKMSFNSSSVIISPGSTFVEAHDLSVDHGFSLCPGDSGSWVVDEATWEIYGHVISADAFGEAQVFPIHLTLESIRKHFNAVRVFIPTSNEISDLQMVSSGLSIDSGGRLEVQITDTSDNGETPQKGIGSNSEGPPDSVAVGDDPVSRKIYTTVSLGHRLWRRTKESGQYFAEIKSALFDLLQILLQLQVEVTQEDSLLHQRSQYMEELIQLIKGCDLTLVHTENSLDQYQDHNLTEEDLPFMIHGLESLKLTLSGTGLQGNSILDIVQSNDSRAVDNQQRRLARAQNKAIEVANRTLMVHEEGFFRDGERLWMEVCSELDQEGYPSQFMQENEEFLKACVHQLQQSTCQFNSDRLTFYNLLRSSIGANSASSIADDINDFIDEPNAGRSIPTDNAISFDQYLQPRTSPSASNRELLPCPPDTTSSSSNVISYPEFDFIRNSSRASSPAFPYYYPSKGEIGHDTRWTMIKYEHISTETLQRLGIRYEERPNYVAILGQYSVEDIAHLANITSQGYGNPRYWATRDFSHQGKQQGATRKPVEITKRAPEGLMLMGDSDIIS